MSSKANSSKSEKKKQNNIKMDVWETVCKDVNWMKLSQDTVKLWVSGLKALKVSSIITKSFVMGVEMFPRVSTFIIILPVDYLVEKSTLKETKTN